MAEKVYSISEAAAMVEVETHVLRYWEEELDIEIHRNEMGHRCYSERDIKILQRVKTLKDRGIQLKAIKDIAHKMYDILDGEAEDSSVEDSEKADTTDVIKESGLLDVKKIDTIRVSCDDDKENTRIVDFKMAQFQNLMDKIVSNSIKDNLKVITQSVSAAVTDDVMKQMDVIIREKEEQEEARYRKLDSTLREYQQARQEIAASEVSGRKRGLFRKKNR